MGGMWCINRKPPPQNTMIDRLSSHRRHWATCSPFNPCTEITGNDRPKNAVSGGAQAKASSMYVLPMPVTAPTCGETWYLSFHSAIAKTAWASRLYLLSIKANVWTTQHGDDRAIDEWWSPQKPKGKMGPGPYVQKRYSGRSLTKPLSHSFSTVFTLSTVPKLQSPAMYIY